MTRKTDYDHDVHPEVTLHESWSTVDATAWDALVGQASPFVEHAWLAGLERTGCATARTGWAPRPVTVHLDGRLVAGAPVWVVDQVRGQFVYQGHWERSAEQAGVPLFPATVVGVPFTPVTGSRFLLAPDAPPGVADALFDGIGHVAHGTRALHVLFPPRQQADVFVERGGFLREQFQFHWSNDGYRTFDDFLGRFRSKRRKELRRERRSVAHLDIATIEGPSPEVLDHVADAYENTVERHGSTDTFLNRAFFEHLGGAFADRLVAVLARDGERVVGAALDVLKGERLYGRYWGQLADVPFLHFELCYHRGIDLCIERGLTAFEPGHGGDHKYRRGFEPVRTWSTHQFAHPGAQRAFARSAERERAWFEEKIAELLEGSPLKPEGSPLKPIG